MRPAVLRPNTVPPVVHEIELHVAAAPELLPGLLSFGVRERVPTFHQRQVGGEKIARAFAYESEELVFGAVAKVVEEDAPHAPRLPTVGDEEVIVGPTF